MTRRTIDAVLVEFDGVLADTAAARRDAMCSVLEEDGLALSPEAYRDACAGLPTRDAVRGALARIGAPADETEMDLLTLRVDRAFSSHVGKGVMLVEGAREVMERIAARARVGIVTRANRRDVEFVLGLAQMEHIVSCVIGAEDASPSKPAPTPYLAALRRLERRRPISAEGLVVALEDSVPGIQSARAAGLRCIAVGDLPAHLAMEADAIIPAITGLDVRRIEQLTTRRGEHFT